MDTVTPTFRPIPIAEVTGWDHEVDVLVVGFGAAGASAAIEAAEAGARTVILEKWSGPGGSSAQSGGELYLGGGTAVQTDCGITDSPEAMFGYLQAALGPHADEDKLRLYCEQSVDHCAWLEDHGVQFQRSLFDEPAWMPSTTDGLMWLGERAWPYHQLAVPAPRGHRPPVPGFAGKALMDSLAAAADQAGADCHLDTQAVALVVEDGRVVGLRARHFDQQLHYRADAVVLTTGGFIDNPQMVADHVPRMIGHGAVSDGGDDGSGIQMAVALGARTRRMGSVQVALTVVPAMACAGIVVNARGERFLNEDVYPGHLSHEAFEHQPGPWWVILDEAGFEALGPAGTWGLEPQHAAETLAELEADLGMPSHSLTNTVAAYNADAAAGADTRFHKGAQWLRVLEPPFAAFDPGAASRRAGGPASGVSGLTLGGLVTSVDGQVQSLSGAPIPGLFAAGRAAHGMHGENYVSGTSLGDGTFFGRRAGRAAAGLAS